MPRRCAPATPICASTCIYLGWLAETRKWLAGSQVSLADFAAAAHLSVLDYQGDVDWTLSPRGPRVVCADEVAPQFSRRCWPTGCRG